MSQEGNSQLGKASKNAINLLQKKNQSNPAPPVNIGQGQSGQKQNKSEETKAKSKATGQQEKVELKIIQQDSNQKEKSVTSQVQPQAISESTSGNNIFSMNKPAQIKTNLFGATFNSNSIFTQNQPSQGNQLQQNVVKKKEDQIQQNNPPKSQPQNKPFTLGGTPATNNSLFAPPKDAGIFSTNNAIPFLFGPKKEETTGSKSNGPQNQQTSSVKEQKKETGSIFGLPQQSNNIFTVQSSKNPAGGIFANQPKIQQDKNGNLLGQGMKKNIFGNLVKETIFNNQGTEKPYFKPTDSYIIEPSPQEGVIKEQKQAKNSGPGNPEEKPSMFGGLEKKTVNQENQTIFQEVNERSSLGNNTNEDVSKQKTKTIKQQQSQPSVSSSSEPMITFEQLKDLLSNPQIIEEQVKESKERILKMLQSKYQNNEPIIIKQDTSDIYERKLRESKRKIRHLETENKKLTQDLQEVYRNIKNKKQRLQTLEKETEQYDFERLVEEIKQKRDSEKIQYPSAAQIQHQVDIVLKYVKKHYLGPHEDKIKNQPSEYLLELNPEHQICRLYQKYLNEIKQNTELELKQKKISEELAQIQKKIEFRLQNKGNGSKENPFSRNKKELCHFDSEKISNGKNELQTGQDLKMTCSQYNPNKNKAKLIQEKLQQLEKLRKKNQALQQELNKKKETRDQLKQEYERNENSKKPDSSIIMRSQIF